MPDIFDTLDAPKSDLFDQIASEPPVKEAVDSLATTRALIRESRQAQLEGARREAVPFDAAQSILGGAETATDILARSRPDLVMKQALGLAGKGLGKVLDVAGLPKTPEGAPDLIQQPITPEQGQQVAEFFDPFGKASEGTVHKGIQKAAGELLAAGADPAATFSLGPIGAEPALARPLFGLPMVAGIPEAVERIKQAKDTPEMVAAALGLTAQIGMPAGIERGLTGKIPPLPRENAPRAIPFPREVTPAEMAESKRRAAYVAEQKAALEGVSEPKLEPAKPTAPTETQTFPELLDQSPENLTGEAFSNLVRRQISAGNDWIQTLEPGLYETVDADGNVVHSNVEVTRSKKTGKITALAVGESGVSDIDGGSFTWGRVTLPDGTVKWERGLRLRKKQGPKPESAKPTVPPPEEQAALQKELAGEMGEAKPTPEEWKQLTKPDLRRDLKDEGITPDNIEAILAGKKTAEQVVDEQLGIKRSAGSIDAKTMIVEENADGSRSIGFTPEAGPASTTPVNVGQMSHADAIEMARQQGVERIQKILSDNGFQAPAPTTPEPTLLDKPASWWTASNLAKLPQADRQRIARSLAVNTTTPATLAKRAQERIAARAKEQSEKSTTPAVRLKPVEDMDVGNGITAKINPNTTTIDYYNNEGFRVGGLDAGELPDGIIGVENHHLQEEARGAGIGGKAVRRLMELTGKAIASDEHPSAAARSMWERLGAKRERIKVGDGTETQVRYVLRPSEKAPVTEPSAKVEPPPSAEPVREEMVTTPQPESKPQGEIKVGDTIEAKSHQITGLKHRGTVTSVQGDEIRMVNEDNAPVLVLRKNVEKVEPKSTPPAQAQAEVTKQPWEKTEREYEMQGMSPAPSAKPLIEEAGKLDNEISLLKSEIQNKNAKYVEASSLSEFERRLLASGKISDLRKDINVRKSALGAAFLSGKSRPFEWAKRDKDSSVRALGQRLESLTERRAQLSQEIAQHSEHSAWVDWAKSQGLIKSEQPKLPTTEAPGTQALGIVPPGVAQVGEVFKRLKHAIQSVLAPATVDIPAEKTSGLIRERGAVMHREWIQAREALKSAKKMFDRQDNAHNLDFIDRMENGRNQATPELQAISQQLRNALASRVQRVRALGTGRLQQVIENYFPHIWKDPTAAANIFQRIFAKRPFEGPKSFLKRRTLPTTADGIAAGLEPVSYNPIELTMVKLHEMDRYIMAHEVLNQMKDQGLAKFVRFGSRAPDGYAKIDDKIAQVIQMQPTTLVSGAPGAPQAVLRGNYYAPEAAARVLNNYLSPGLRGNILYDTARGFGNALNQAQLGLSAYHLTFTGIDSATSKVALGAEQIGRGQVLRGTANLLKGTIGNLALYAPIENYIKGNKVLREYTKPGSVGGEVTAAVDALIRAGGRVEMDTFYKNSAVESFWKSFREGTPTGYGKALWKAPWALLELASKPVMEIWVPRMKLGIFYDMAKEEMQRNPGASPEQLRQTMGKAWDSVDNRMGQMVYDNLFWNKTLKDLSMLAVRSVGWNLGTLRELGGGMLDTATVLRRLQNGDPLLTHRMAYLIALPITVGTLGAMYQYLATGKGPEKLEDYFLPKNGQKRADGSDERIILPSYMKDVLPLVKAGQEKGGFGVIGRAERMVVNKASPWISLVGDMLSNKDFYGRPIANPEDPLLKKVEAYAEYVRQQFKPFSFRAYEKQTKEGLATKAQSFAGLQPAPPELQPTAARETERLARQFMAKRGIVHPQSPISDYHDLRVALEVGDDKKAIDEIQKLRKSRSDLVIFNAFQRARTHPFTGSLANEGKFRATLSQEELAQYQAARKERQELFKKFQALWAKRGKR